MIDPGYALGCIAAMAAVTFGLRALPFVASRWLRNSEAAGRLGQFLPLAIMTLLLLHAGVQAAEGHPDDPWVEVLTLALVIVLQQRWRHPLLSMLIGTAVYVALRNG